MADIAEQCRQAIAMNDAAAAQWAEAMRATSWRHQTQDSRLTAPVGGTARVRARAARVAAAAEAEMGRAAGSAAEPASVSASSWDGLLGPRSRGGSLMAPCSYTTER